MTDESANALDDLERQWRSSQSTHLGLQLAEEHRRRENLDRAIEVLEESVEKHPRHMSSRVALSRYLVDRERFEPAVEHLLQIVEVDPVHLVANKLLVRSYIGLGRLDEARDKLDIYEMLGEGDSDIESLRATLDGGVDESGAESGSEPLPADRPAPDRMAEPEPETDSATLGEKDGGEEPFGFGWAAIEEPTPPAESSSDDVFALDSAPLAAGPFGAEPAPSREAGDPVAVDDRPAVTTEPTLAGASTAAEETERDEGGPQSEESESREPEAPAEATVTLGNLYLQQGLTAEAAQSFRGVLARDPGNRAALAGLEAIETASPEGATLIDRKKAALIAYRARLRANLEART